MDLSLQPKNFVYSPNLLNCFNPCFNGSFTSTWFIDLSEVFNTLGFNPCFNGSFTSTKFCNIYYCENYIGFNPCFNGFFTSTYFTLCINMAFVSILVLMDLSLQPYYGLQGSKTTLRMFQSLF